MMALNWIAGDPSLNDRQKKIVGDVLELFKQTIQNQQSITKPAQ